jgi:hypothetical protein
MTSIRLCAALSVLVALAAFGQSTDAPQVTEFRGRKVRIVKPELDENGFAKEAALVCFGGLPADCYNPGTSYGLDPELKIINLGNRRSALLFTAVNWRGGSGIGVHLALLQIGSKNQVLNLFPTDLQHSGIGQHEFLSDKSLSNAPIFVLADYVWGRDESHFDDHRFTISVYVLTPIVGLPDSDEYVLADQFMTARKYPSLGDNKVDILGAEKPEILARLKRIKAEVARRATKPR